MRLSELETIVESLLFISGEAVPLTTIAQTIEMDKATARAIIHSLAGKYEEEKEASASLRWRMLIKCARHLNALSISGICTKAPIGRA